MYLLPKPKKWILNDGEYVLSKDRRITLDESCPPEVFAYAKQLNGYAAEYCGYDLQITRGRRDGAGIFLQMDSPDGSLPAPAEVYDSVKLQAFRIRIGEDGIIITGASMAGLFYGIQTFRQILLQSGPVLPYMEISDEPVLPHRGYLHDVTRGRIPMLSYLKKLADKLAACKINQLHLYVEHSFLFSGYGEVCRDDTPLTQQDILEFDAYCRERWIDLVPCMASFGHLYKVLRTNSFGDLCELPGMSEEPFGFADRMRHHTLNVSDPESLRFAKRLIDEYLPLFSSRFFNIGADETFDLGKGKSREMAGQKGLHRLYIDFVRELCEHVKAKGRVPMFWGDIILHFPDDLQELPPETICLNWGYEPDVPEELTGKLSKTGAKLYQCPGVSGWNEFIPRIRDSYDNIRRMCGYAVKYHAEGLLNTDWGDYGHINHPDFSMPGMMYGAALSWNPESGEFENLNRAISVLEYGDPTEKAVSVLAGISGCQIYGWRDLVDYKEERIHFKKTGNTDAGNTASLSESSLPELERSLKRLDEISGQLYQIISGLQMQKRPAIRPFLNAIAGIRLMQMTGYYVSMFENPSQRTEKRGDLPGPSEVAALWENWLLDYKNEWRKISRESELHRIQEVICCYADYLRET